MKTGYLKRAGLPGARDRAGARGVEDGGEQPLSVRAVARAGPFGVSEVAGQAGALAAQLHVVLREREDLAVGRQAVQELVAAAVLAEHEPAAWRSEERRVGKAWH